MKIKFPWTARSEVGGSGRTPASKQPSFASSKSLLPSHEWAVRHKLNGFLNAKQTLTSQQAY